jgi:hypothetical protein
MFMGLNKGYVLKILKGIYKLIRIWVCCFFFKEQSYQHPTKGW